MHRRSFLKYSATGLLSANVLFSLSGCTHKKFFNPDQDILLSGGHFNDNETKQHALIVINLSQQEKRVIETPFLPHDILVDPNDKYRVICIEKKGTNACTINLQTMSVSHTFHSEANRLFSGHGCFSNDGKNLYCIEYDQDNRQGSISIRHPQRFEIIKQLPTLGLLPHDCQLDKNNVLTVSNTGHNQSGFHQPSLVSIDLNTEKLLKRIHIDRKDLNCGHFILHDNNAIILSAPLLTEEPDSGSNNTNDINTGGISIGSIDSTITTLSEPELVIKRMTGEALSMAVNRQKSILAVTHPEANLLTFWSIRENKIIRAYGFENPRGLAQTMDKQFFILSYGKEPAMVKIAMSDLMPQADSVVQPTLANGEHLISWTETLREIMPTRIYD